MYGSLPLGTCLEAKRTYRKHFKIVPRREKWRAGRTSF